MRRSSVLSPRALFPAPVAHSRRLWGGRTRSREEPTPTRTVLSKPDEMEWGGGRGRLCAGCFDALNLQVFDIKDGGKSSSIHSSQNGRSCFEHAHTPGWGGGRGVQGGGRWNEKLSFCASRIWFSLALTFRDKRPANLGGLCVSHSRRGGGRLGLVALGNDSLCRPNHHFISSEQSCSRTLHLSSL